MDRRSDRRRPAGSASCVVRTAAHSTVRLRGRVDRVAAARTGGWINGLLVAGERNIVVDVSMATECHVHLLSVLSRARSELAGSNASIVMVGVRLPPFAVALTLASVDEVFLVYEAVHRESGAGRAVPDPSAIARG